MQTSLSSPLLPIVMLFLGGLSLCGILLAIIYPSISAGSVLNRRFNFIVGDSEASRAGASMPENARKRSVEETLLEAARKESTKSKRKVTLQSRLRQAKLSWDPRAYLFTCVATGLLAYSIVQFAAGMAPLISSGFGFAAGVLLPHLYVGTLRKRRFKRFAAEFPNAVDVIVRGMKAGLPLVDSLKIVAAEGQEPVKSEFKTVIEDQTLGMPLDEAVQRLPMRIPLSETNFFAIVIAMQSRTGGSLAEALGNLSKVIRERRKMQAKIRAMSAEAKASGGIIASLPFVVGTLVYITSPDYMGLLVTTLEGKMVLAGSGLWMLIGTMVMRKMIAFDF
jgi:tight adherence protein B